jgi:anti-anti-sigma factor
MLTVAIQESGNGVVLQCQGRMVRGYEGAVLCAALAHDGRNVALDLAGVEAIDAAGVGLLVSLQASGIYLKLLNPSERVLDVLRVTQLESIFEISDSPSTEEIAEEMAVK